MIIAFSFLSLLDSDYKSAIANFTSLAASEWLHFDVMDGRFVSNSTFDYRLVKEINENNKIFSDVHLMITQPDVMIKNYADAGTNQLTFHYEAVEENRILDIIKEIRKNNMRVGISIKPTSDVRVLDKYLSYLDYILIMSVEPGKGGQKFKKNSLEKIRYLKSLQNKYRYLIGVDGGINDSTSKLVKESGADVIVVGSYLANNINKETISKLK